MKRTAAIIFRSLLLLITGILIGYFIADDNLRLRGMGYRSADDDKLGRILQLVKENYVDTVNIGHIEGAAIDQVLQNLDPHSVYLPPQQAQSINERLEGGFDGVGLEYLLLRDTVYITQIYPDGPAARAGIRAGDRVLTVDNKPFSGTGLTNKVINKTFRGVKNTNLVLGIGAARVVERTLTLTRGRVGLTSMDAAYMAAPDVGYIKLGKFAATTDTDFRAAVKKLKNNGMQKLVLDLRGNGGGYLNAATALADEFLTKGQLIVYTKGIHEPRTDYFATDSGAFQQGNIAVLIDEYSASASEIVAGALQDLDRATIIGRRSFGKGLVQEQFPFTDGSAINLTVARYYTPSGRSIQKSYKNGLESYHNEISDRMQKGEMFSAENSLKDSAFRTASIYHTTKGKKVYSGGGIMPDLFIPADTNLNTPLVQTMNNKQLFTAYALDKLRPILKKYPASDDFVNSFNVSPEMVDDFIAYASNSIKTITPAELTIARPSIKSLIKAYAGRLKWGDDVYYHCINADDETVRKAVAVVGEKE